jgi:tRNA nucleotidyltransferase/poly(A) polymerase
MHLPFSGNIFPDITHTAAFIVGGAVRDALLGGAPVDYDIAVAGDCRAFALETAAKISARAVKLGKPGQAVYRIVSGSYTLDIAPLAGGSLETDLGRRDFTINALAYDLRSNRIIDCYNGLEDLKAGSVRMVAPSVFKKDPVRLIRAYRLAVRRGFEVEVETSGQIRQDAPLLSNAAGERIRDELVKILAASVSHPIIDQMSQCGLLASILPELEALRHCPADRHHAFDAHTHSLRAYARLEHILNHLESFLPPGSARRGAFPETGSTSMLKFAMLIHDIGKPPVKSVDAQGHVHFYGHAAKSAEMFNSIRTRLKLSNKDAEYIAFIIRNHLRPLHLFTALQEKPSIRSASRRITARFFMKCGSRTPDLLLHGLADMSAKTKNGGRRARDFERFVKEMLRTYLGQHEPMLTAPPLLNGHDLIHTFGLEPSPLFKRILNRVEAERLAGRLHSKSDAEDWVRRFLEKRREKERKGQDARPKG